jgi:hypothetical protein
MSNTKATFEARKLFRREVNDSWGYLVRKTRTKESSLREKRIEEARRAYWQGMERAWEIYTEDNTIVKPAKEALEKSISQANRLYLQEDLNYNPKHFMKAMYRAHDEFADRVAPIFKVFMLDMRRYNRSKS